MYEIFFPSTEEQKYIEMVVIELKKINLINDEELTYFDDNDVEDDVDDNVDDNVDDDDDNVDDVDDNVDDNVDDVDDNVDDNVKIKDLENVKDDHHGGDEDFIIIL
jgi:hypothetical protein